MSSRQQEVLENIQRSRIDIYKKISFRCNYCGRTSLFGELGFVQTYYYKPKQGDEAAGWEPCGADGCLIRCLLCHNLTLISEHQDKDGITTFFRGLRDPVEKIFHSVWKQTDEEKPFILVTGS